MLAVAVMTICGWYRRLWRRRRGQWEAKSVSDTLRLSCALCLSFVDKPSSAYHRANNISRFAGSDRASMQA